MEKKESDGKNGKLNFKWASERLGMLKQGRCEILTIGREVGGRAADKSEARRRVRAKGHGSGLQLIMEVKLCLQRKTSMGRSPNVPNEWRNPLWLHPGGIHRPPPAGHPVPLQQLPRNPSV